VGAGARAPASASERAAASERAQALASRLVPLGISERDLQRHLAIAERLDLLGREKMARRIRGCNRRGIILECDCGPKKAKKVRFVCDTRSCQSSSYRRFSRLKGRYGMIVRSMKRAKFVTLGYRASPLLEFDGVLSSFHRFRRKKVKTEEYDSKTGRRLYRRVWNQDYGLLCLEAKWKNDHWWIHLHIISEGPWIDIVQLTRDWEEHTGQTSANVDVKRAYRLRGAMRYLLGYTFKHMDAPPNEEAAFLNAAYHKRFLSIFGLNREKLHKLIGSPYIVLCHICGSPYEFVGFDDARGPRVILKGSLDGPPHDLGESFL